MDNRSDSSGQEPKDDKGNVHKTLTLTLHCILAAGSRQPAGSAAPSLSPCLALSVGLSLSNYLHAQEWAPKQLSLQVTRATTQNQSRNPLPCIGGTSFPLAPPPSALLDTLIHSLCPASLACRCLCLYPRPCVDHVLVSANNDVICLYPFFLFFFRVIVLRTFSICPARSFLPPACSCCCSSFSLPPPLPCSLVLQFSGRQFLSLARPAIELLFFA